MPSHYPNQCWNIVNWTYRNKPQWNFNRNSNIFIEENTFGNVVWEMSAIFLGLNVLRDGSHLLLVTWAWAYHVWSDECCVHWWGHKSGGWHVISIIVRRAGLLWSDFFDRTSLIATRFWVLMICPIIKCLTVLEFSFILFDLCLFITIFNFILNYVPIVTFWILTYHKIWILLIIFCFIWSYWIIYFLTCLEVFWSVVS